MFNTCYYPTTVIFVDDHQGFLTSLPLQLDENIAYQQFLDPGSALQYLNTHPYTVEQGLQAMLPTHSDEPHDVEIDVRTMLRFVNDQQRFAEPSVVVVDYDMPGIDGLELCQQIQNPYVKKILLTGVADEVVGVEALNDKIIDYYINKSSPALYQRLNAAILKLQQRYFQAAFAGLNAYLAQVNGLFKQPQVQAKVQQIIDQHHIVEYFGMTQPLGYFMMSAEGDAYQLLIYTDEILDTHFEIARDLQAPTELLQRIALKQEIPYFSDAVDGYYHEQVEDWRASLYPAQAINNQYYMALATITDVRSLPYRHYLDNLVA